MSPSHSHALKFDSDPNSVTNFVDLLHGECTPLQWLRELVVNSIEAIVETGKPGTILVHAVQQDMGEGIGTIRKLAVTDTGEGIAEDRLYSSFQVAMTSRGTGNYGIGAKIAALPLNPAGMIYRSQIEGRTPAELIWYRSGPYSCYEARGWIDEPTNEIRYVTPPSCEESSYSRITDAGHGTQVVLCGENAEHDTCRTLGPSTYKGAGNLHWAIRQLNFKFWKIPKSIEIRVENAKTNRSDSDPRDYIVHGGETGMKSFAAESGVVELESNPYKVRWFLLNESVTQRRNSHNGWGEGRIIAALYHEKTGVTEVYAMLRTRRGAALMNDFGIYTGAERVVLLIEPTQMRQDLMQPTTARDDLRVGDEGNVSSAYKEIGQEFAGLMAEKAPKLAEYVRKQLEGMKSTSDEQNLKEVIAQAIELYKIRDFRRLAKGRTKAVENADMDQIGDTKQRNVPAENELDPPEDSDTGPPDSVSEKQNRPKPPPRPRPRLNADSEGNDRANSVPPDIQPKDFHWGCLNEDEITNYTTHNQTVVVVNTEGETYNRLLALYKNRPDFAEYPEAVEQVIRSKCEASLQLSIFTLEQEFLSRGKRLGIDFERFYELNRGRVCLDAMASREVHNSIVRETKNMISKTKSKAAAEASKVDSEAA